MVRHKAENGRLPLRPPSEEIATCKVEVNLAPTVVNLDGTQLNSAFFLLDCSIFACCFFFYQVTLQLHTKQPANKE